MGKASAPAIAAARRLRRRSACITLLGGLVLHLAAVPSHAQRFMERLDRGLVAIHQGQDGVFLSWRLLGTEDRDVGFNVYRESGDGPAEKLHDQPLTAATNFQDRDPDLSRPTSYFRRSTAWSR
jgi:rhamnogalacturonan endolyase